MKYEITIQVADNPDSDRKFTVEHDRLYTQFGSEIAKVVNDWAKVAQFYFEMKVQIDLESYIIKKIEEEG